MSIEEQQKIKSAAYSEAMRYMENAKATLQKARKEGKHYSDRKYVSMACLTAYNGAFLALDAYLQLKGVELPKKKHRSIYFYTLHVKQFDRKLAVNVNESYNMLCRGYYDGITVAIIVEIGFEHAYQIIDKIKPDHMQELPPPPPKPSLLKRLYTFLYFYGFIPCWYFFNVVKSVHITFQYK